MNSYEFFAVTSLRTVWQDIGNIVAQSGFHAPAALQISVLIVCGVGENIN